jgi:hypothetical protein
MPTFSGPKSSAQREELLADERLDRAGVERAAAAGTSSQVHRHGDQRLARAGRRVEDDVLAGEDLEDRLLLGRVELEPGLGHPVEEDLEDLVAGGGGWLLGQEARGELAQGPRGGLSSADTGAG